MNFFKKDDLSHIPLSFLEREEIVPFALLEGVLYVTSSWRMNQKNQTEQALLEERLLNYFPEAKAVEYKILGKGASISLLLHRFQENPDPGSFLIPSFEPMVNSVFLTRQDIAHIPQSFFIQNKVMPVLIENGILHVACSKDIAQTSAHLSNAENKLLHYFPDANTVKFLIPPAESDFIPIEKLIAYIEEKYINNPVKYDGTISFLQKDDFTCWFCGNENANSSMTFELTSTHRNICSDCVNLFRSYPKTHNPTLACDFCGLKHPRLSLVQVKEKVICKGCLELANVTTFPPGGLAS